jgi:hypothetical protein
MNAASRPEQAGGWTSGRGMLFTWGLALAGVALALAAFWWGSRYIAVHHLGPLALWGAALAFAAAIFGIAWGSSALGRRLGGFGPVSAAARRYRRRLLLVQALYIVAVVAAVAGYVVLPKQSPWMWPLALLPALAMTGFIVAMALYLREETDELERAIHSEAGLWATAGTLALAAVWGFLEMFDLVPHAQAWAAFAVWSILSGPAQLLVRRRYC